MTEQAPEPRYPAYVFGLDLGSLSDYSGLVVVELQDEEPPRRHAVRHIHRWDLGTRYQDIVEDTLALLVRQPLSGENERHLVIDATGVGQGVVQMFDRKVERVGVLPVGVTITAGYDVVRSSPVDLRVPKRELIAAMQSALGSARLEIASGLPFAKVLQDELLAMRIKQNPRTGNVSYEAWRERDHDDLALALAMAVWYSEHELPSLTFAGLLREERQRERERKQRLAGAGTIGLEHI